MSSNLIAIARSGTAAARIALDLTAQNIANADNQGYVRRSASLADLTAANGPGRIGDISLSGVRVAGIVRNADPIRQAEVRRTGSDQTRADAELSGLQSVQTAVEQAGIYPAIVEFESTLGQLASDPTNIALRGAVIASARTMSSAFNIGADQLDAAQQRLTSESGAFVDRANTLATDLARVNLGLLRTTNGSSDQTALLDRRDGILRSLSDIADVTTAFDTKGAVTVRIGGNGGPVLVSAGTTQALVMTSAPNGLLTFTLGSMPVAPASGALAGNAQALSRLDLTRTQLSTVAANLIASVNSAQTNGIALDGSSGQPVFSGTDASDIAIAMNSGAGLATAPTGSPAGSRDASNLAAVRSALSANDPAIQFDALLFDLSSVIAGRTTTREALGTIADSARGALSAEAGVNLDQEAINLVRFQQAFQASGKVLQVAATMFDTMLSIR